MDQKRISLRLAQFWLGGLLLGSLLVRCNFFQDYAQVDVNQVFLEPSLFHWFGTDSLGRDLFFRLLQGSGTSLIIAMLSVLMSLGLAVLYGGASGWLGKHFDWILMTFLDIWLSLPSVVLAVLVSLLVASWSDSLFVVSFVIGSTHWGRLARLIRGEVLRLRERNFIGAAVLLGASDWQILSSHIFRHLSPVIGVYLVYQIPGYILAESFLSFIGLGIQPPETSWGLLLQDGWRSIQVFPHVVFFPAFFLFLTVISLNIIWFDSRRHEF